MKSEQFERELRFIAYYLHKGSHTYSNGRRSALKAGYRDSYARKILSCLDWQKMKDSIIGVQEELQYILGIK